MAWEHWLDAWEREREEKTVAADDIVINRVIVHFTISPDYPHASSGPVERELPLAEFLDRYDQFFWARYGEWLKRHAADFPA